MASPSVAIIGGGVAGLVAGGRLAQLGITNVTVFDTGRHAVGGRCSSRDFIINGEHHVFDHSCQYFTVSEPQFANIVSFLHKKGAVKVWDGNVGHLNKHGTFRRYPSGVQCFVGTSGMRSVAECLATLTTVRRPLWIGSVTWHPDMRKWRVDEEGFFDYLVVAHNGKCADRLMSRAGAPDVHALLVTRFADRLLPAAAAAAAPAVSAGGGARGGGYRKSGRRGHDDDQKMTLSSLWVLLVAFPQSLGLDEYEGAHVEGDPEVSWIANNTAKLKQKKGGRSAAGGGGGGGTECWTILSTPHVGHVYKVPQEAVPPEKAKKVTDLLLNAFARVTKLPRRNLQPCFSHVQLWGAGVPLNTLATRERCVFDWDRHVGVCGDWLVSPCIQGAALSGISLAEKIHQHSRGMTPDRTSPVSTFQPVNGSSIGAFPTNANMQFKPKS